MVINRPIALLAVSGMLAAMSASAQTAGLQVPVLGYVASQPPEASPVLRAIHGVPGAVSMGDPLELPPDVSAIHLAPANKFAVAQIAGRLALLDLNGTSISSPRYIPGAAGTFDRVFFSAAGTALLAYSAGENKLTIVRGLPASPEVTSVEDLAAQSLGAFATGAVSDDGRVSFGGFADGSVWQFSAGQKASELFRASLPAAMAVRKSNENSGELLLADGASKSLLLLSWDGAAATAKTLAGETDGIQQPSFLQVSEDGNTAWLGDLANNTILTANLDTGSLATLPSRVTPVRLTKVGGKANYLIESQDGSSALWTAPALESSIWLLSSAR